MKSITEYASAAGALLAKVKAENGMPDLAAYFVVYAPDWTPAERTDLLALVAEFATREAGAVRTALRQAGEHARDFEEIARRIAVIRHHAEAAVTYPTTETKDPR